MNWYYVGIFIAILVPLVIWLRSPYRYRGVHTQDFERFIRMLMTQLDLGAILLLRHKKTRTFVQFAKYGDKGGMRLHYGFPRARWSDKRFEDVKRAVEALDVCFHMEKTGNQEVPEYLEIEWANPSDNAYREASEVAIRTFRSFDVSSDEVFEATFRGARDPQVQGKLLAVAESDERAPQFLRRAAKWANRRRREGVS